MQKETFGEGSAAQSAAGKKGEWWGGTRWAEGIIPSELLQSRQMIGREALRVWCGVRRRPGTCSPGHASPGCQAPLRRKGGVPPLHNGPTPDTVSESDSAPRSPPCRRRARQG